MEYLITNTDECQIIYTDIITDKHKTDLETLIRDAFEKKLTEKYFDEENIIGLLYEKDFKGAAIIEEIEGIPYLDKLSVSKERQGNGLGGCLLKAAIQKYNGFMLRSRKENPFNKTYNQYCEITENSGCIEKDNWYIYHYNLDINDDKVKSAIEIINQKKETLI